MSSQEIPPPTAAARVRGEDSDDQIRWAVAAPAIVESLTDALVVADEGGRMLFVNRAAEALLARDRSELLGTSVTSVVPGRLITTYRRGLAQTAGGADAGFFGKALSVRVLRPDGSEVPVELVVDAARLPGGERFLVGTMRDVSDRLDLERRSHMADRLLGLLAQALPEGELESRLLETIGSTLECDWCALWRVDDDGLLRCRQVWSGDEQAERSLLEFETSSRRLALRPGEGLPGRVLAEGKPLWVLDLGADPRILRAAEAERAGLSSGFAFPVLLAGGVVSVIELFARQPRPLDQPLLGSMVTIGARLGEIFHHREEEDERQRMLDELVASRRLHEFLLRAVGTLAEAADYRQTLERLASVAVPALGDICLIDVLDEDGRLVRMAGRHGEPSFQHLVDKLELEYAPDPRGEHPSIRVIKTGESSWSPEMSEDFLRLTSRDEHHFELIKSLGFRSYMTVPLATPTKTLGAVTLVTTLAGRRYSESDLAVAEQFASQITAVIDSARVHETEHRIALTLQRSLLPDQLPDLSGAQVAARYLPGSDDAEVGGDWYDILCLSRDRIGLVAGDVEGHDIEAATVMGQLRNALRAYALDDHDPADTLDRLARFGDRVGLERMATVVFAELDPQTGELTVASAGHPQPIIVTESGAAFVVAFPSDPPLGVVLAPHRQYTTLLEPRAAVVLYTDGLIEDRAVAVDESIRHLLSAVQAAGTDPERICAAIEQLALGDGGHRDDVAVLVLQRMTDPEPDG